MDTGNGISREEMAGWIPESTVYFCMNPPLSKTFFWGVQLFRQSSLLEHTAGDFWSRSVGFSFSRVWQHHRSKRAWRIHGWNFTSYASRPKKL